MDTTTYNINIIIYYMYIIICIKTIDHIECFFPRKTIRCMFCQPTSPRPTIPSRADLPCHHAMPLAPRTVVFFCAEGGKKLPHLVSNLVKTIFNRPLGNGLYHLFMVIWGIAYYCFTHIIC